MLLREWLGFGSSRKREAERRKARLGSGAAACFPERRESAAAETPFDAPPRLFCPRDRASAFRPRSADDLRRGLASIPAAFAAVHPFASSHLRQSPVVGPDGYPRPPECARRRPPHARRRRIPPRANKRPWQRPSKWDGMNRNIIQKRKMSNQILRCCVLRLRHRRFGQGLGPKDSRSKLFDESLPSGRCARNR